MREELKQPESVCTDTQNPVMSDLHLTLTVTAVTNYSSKTIIISYLIGHQQNLFEG